MSTRTHAHKVRAERTEAGSALTYLPIMSSDASSPQNARSRARDAARALIQSAQAWTPASLAKAVREGQREALAQAITWVESAHPEHQDRNEAPCASPQCGAECAHRIYGNSWAGKSTLIERFGLDAVRRGTRVAVLAVDPSSQRTQVRFWETKRACTTCEASRCLRPPFGCPSTLGGVARPRPKPFNFVKLLATT